MLGYPQEDFSYITIGPLHVAVRDAAIVADAVPEAIYLAFQENRNVVLEFNNREFEISPEQIIHWILTRMEKATENLAGDQK